ncbi:MAG TPA: hypothetical protein VFF53_08135 [Geobacteraceae bacterium]|nr:hypothetical protein [Geobacteraceae bacterium]
MSAKKMLLTIYAQNHLRPDWRVDLSGDDFQHFIECLEKELLGFGIHLASCRNDEICIDVNSYADLLNVVRVSSPSDGFANKCVGHILGKSQNLNLYEDIKRAVNRVAFAPETVPPDDHNRKVCHNCGCGC